ncbi:MAG: ParA family protein [Bdellovibrionales bacterium]|nr:ParA family protein [Bdellovibrionales bacterium]
MHKKSAYVTAISNQKGGVGKTTTAINLAASLGGLEKKTLLVDMDPQANATSGCGVYGLAADHPTVYEGLLSQASAVEIIVPTETPFLDLMPAKADLVGFEVEGLDLENRHAKLLHLLLQVRDKYDHIIIDCPPSLSLLTLNALCAAQGVLVPLQTEYYALEGLTRLTNTISRIQQSLNPTLELIGILLTMYDKRTSLSWQVEQEVVKHFESKLFQTRIPRNVRLSEAPSFGKPIIMYDICSKGAQSYIQCAHEFDFLIQQKQKEINHDRKQTTGSRDRNTYPTDTYLSSASKD